MSERHPEPAAELAHVYAKTMLPGEEARLGILRDRFPEKVEVVQTAEGAPRVLRAVRGA